jgi:PAS domain S-box-containing protein
MDNISLLAKDGTLLWENPAVNSTLGYEHDEFVDHNIFELMHPDDMAWTSELFVKVIREAGSQEHGTFRLKHHDGTWRWVEATATNMLDEPSVNAVVINYRDVTERRLMEEALRESEERYRLITQNAEDMIWTMNMNFQLIYVSPAVEQAMGYSAEEILASPPEQFLTPRSFAIGIKAFAEEVEKAQIQPDANYSRLLELEYCRRDGSTFWVEMKFSFFRDEDGHPIGILGVGRDITERKQAEARINDLLSLNERMLNHSPLGILTYKLTGECIFANQNAAVMVGADVETLMSQNFHTIEAWKKSGLSALAEKAIAAKSAVTGDIHHISTFGKDLWMTVHCVTFTSHNEEHLLLSILDITERKQAEQKLLQSQQELTEAQQVAKIGSWSFDPVKNEIRWSDELYRIFGVEREKFIHTYDAFLELIHSEDRLNVKRRNNSALENGTSFEIEYRIITAIGEVKTISEIGYAIADDHKQIIRLFGTAQDITQRKRTELERQALFEVIQGLGVTQDLKEFLKLIHIAIAKVVYAENFFVVLHLPDTGLFEEIYSVDQYDPPAPPSSLEKSITSYVFRSGEPLLLKEVDFEILASQGEVELVGTPSASWLGVPLKTSGRTIGVMAVQDYENDKRYSEHDKEFLTSIATQVALAIERKRAEDALHRSEALHRQAMEVAGAVPYYETYYDEGNSIKYEFIGEGIRQITGYGPEEFSAKLWDSLVEEINLVEELAGYSLDQGIQKVRKGEISTWKCEHRIRARDGKIHWVFEAAVELRDEKGVSYGSIGTYQDITERKRAETAEREQRLLAETLRDTSQILSSSLNYGEVLDRILTAVGQVVPHDAGTITLIEDGFARVVRSQGYDKHASNAEIMGIRLSLEDIANLREMLETKQPVIVYDTFSYPGWKRMKATDWLRSNVGAPISIDGEVIGFILLDSQTPGFFTPIHAERLQAFANQAAVAIHNADLLQQAQNEIVERKRAEEALRESEARFGNAFEFAPIGIALVALDGKWVKVNQALCEFLGYTEHELMSKTFQEITHPDDLNADHRFMDQILSGEIISYQMEKRYFHKKGNIVWALLSVSLVKDSEGKPQYFISQIQDISERKHAEDEIQRRAKETSALLETSLALTNLDLKAILQSIGSSAKALFAADGCRVFLMQPDGETLRCVLALQENAAAFSDLKIKLGEGVTGAVATSGKAEIVNEMQNDPRAVQVPGTENEEESIMFAPLKERERILGVLSIRRAGADRPFQSADLELLEAFASMAASAVSNARHFEEAQQRLDELEALYENGLAVGQLLEPRGIGNRIIETFARYLSWHHVTIRLLRPETDELEVIAFNLPGMDEDHKPEMEYHFNQMVSKTERGLSGWVVQTGTPLRTGNVHAHPRYVDTQVGIQSGLYMPLKIGDRVIGVISVESEAPDAFTEQDERLLATLGSQAAVAFENARLYQTAHQELLERTRAQAALWASETHYRELADSITDILFELDYNLTYTHWNKASEMFSGIPAEDAIGKTMKEVWGTSAEQLGSEEVYRNVLKERQVRTFETEAFPRGQKRVLEIHAYPSTRGVSVVARDVTERKLDETLTQKRVELMEYSAHHSLEELMQKTVDEISELTGSHIGFLHLIEEDQRTISLQAWSTETIRIAGNIEHKDVHQPVESAGVWADALRQRRSIIHNDYESLSDRKGLPDNHPGVRRELVIPILRDERVAALLAIGNKSEAYTQRDVEITERFADYAWDIIERRQMEAALAEERNQLARRVEERTADLSRANSNLARALRVKDEFLANMSHELRTPLNAILGLSESLSEQVAGPLNEKQQKYLGTINESGHHLLSLINDILDLAKIEAGQITLDINKVDVNSVCQASLRMIRQLAQKKNQEVLFEIDSDLGLMWADERRLKQMIVNLLSNAVKFTPDSGKLGLEVHGDQAGNRVLITVWDTGIGISNQDMERLFKPFVQLDSGLAREATGTGLGLALVAQMARLHGGSANVESQVGEGSRFTVLLPWEPALAADASTRLRNTGKFRAIDPNATNKPTILLIEDTREVVMMLVDYLEMSGFNMVTAQDGADGIQQARLSHPDLILMDVMMPGMDGFETTRKLRMDAQFKDTPIIALTALAMPSDRQRCLDAGMDEYMSKPVNLKALVKLIRNILLAKEDTKPK